MWKTIEDFAEWYKAQGYPIRPPADAPIYATDNAHAIVLYREGQFQAELYLVTANTDSPEHGHPGVESIIMHWAGAANFTINTKMQPDIRKDAELTNEDGTSVLFGKWTKLPPGSTHALFAYEKGAAFLSLEKWPEGMEPTSVTVHWEGASVGKQHDELLKR